MLHERVKLRQGYRRKDLIKEMIPSSAADLTESGSCPTLSPKSKDDAKWDFFAPSFVQGSKKSSATNPARYITENF